MTPDPLTLAAHYLRRLADVEDAHQRGAVRELDGLLAGVDPVEVRRLAEEIGTPQTSILFLRPNARDIARGEELAERYGW